MKRIAVTIMVLVLAVGLTGCLGGDGGKLTPDQAAEQLDALAKKVSYKTIDHQPDPNYISDDDVISALPTLEKYPLAVTGRGAIDVEIFSSTEKSNVKKPGWLDKMAAEFNKSDMKIAGKSVSVSVRPVASGAALDYITSRVHIPDAYTPSNELWGLMVEGAGVPIDKVAGKLTGNVAGIAIKPEVYKSLSTTYGKNLSFADILDAVEKKQAVLGYTNPNTSSTGLNVLTQTLKVFDADNPLSQTAIDEFSAFQQTVPRTPQTTDEMASIAAKGMMSVATLEAQAQSTQPLLKDWKFIPVGVRHDSPMYLLNDAPAEKRAVLEAFVKFCQSDEAQKEATSFGFNKYNEYAGVTNTYTGTELFAALQLWKQNKDSGRPVISVFVVDRSGSMEGEKILNVKKALLGALPSISEGNSIGLVSYSGQHDITLDMPITKISQIDQSAQFKFAGAVADLQTDGQTATNSALVVALKLLRDAQAQTPDAKLRIFLLSDGQTNEGLVFNRVIDVVEGLGVPVYSIGFEVPEGLDDLKELSSRNEASYLDAQSDDVIYKIRSLFISEM